MWLLAIKALVADRAKLLTSLIGVAFSVILVNLQGGLLLGLIQKASLLVDFGQAEIWVGHRYMSNVDMGTFIPERWLQRIKSVEGVQRAEPYIVMYSQMTMADGHFENVAVVGSDPASLLGNAWVMAEGDPHDVCRPDGILVDVCDLDRLGNCRIGDIRELNNKRARVVGLTRGIVGFTTTPYVFTTLDRARSRYCCGVPHEHCSYFLVKVRPGADVSAVCARIKERVPEVDVLDKRSYGLMCMQYWLTRTGIGLSFGIAALLGLLVGLAIVAQTLYASVIEHIKEFGTLKAMGADDGCIARFIVAQAIGNAVFGSLIGLAGTLLAAWLLDGPRTRVVLTWAVAVVSVTLISMVCLAAAWFPYWRIHKIDPASVLRS